MEVVKAAPLTPGIAEFTSGAVPKVTDPSRKLIVPLGAGTPGLEFTFRPALRVTCWAAKAVPGVGGTTRTTVKFLLMVITNG